jgi:hypothetical protein
MRRIYCASFVLLAMCAMARASDPVGIYALIDRVVIEPSDSQPQRVQIWGAFSLAVKNHGDEYSPPVRGYLYYSLDGQKDAAARAEWADMKAMAGTGQIIAFASRYRKAGTVRHGAGPDADKNALPPDPYPVGVGLTRVRADENSEHVQLLRKIPSASSPADGSTAPAGAVKLVAGNIAAADSRPTYLFEIENAAGEKESGQVAQGDKQTEWSPKMHIKSGEKYTWRVSVEDAKGRGPVATSTFLGK